MPASPHTVSDVMTHTAVAVGRHAPYKQIVELMDQWRVSALPVLEGEGRVIGVVSEADLLPKEEFHLDDPERPNPAVSDDAKAAGVIAEELMSSPPVTVHANATLAEAARIMARQHVKRLPVVSDTGMLEGIVSRGDLLKVFLRPDEEIADEIRRAIQQDLPVISEVVVSVTDGVVTLGGHLSDHRLVALLARAVRAVEGVVDIRLDLDHAAS